MSLRKRYATTFWISLSAALVCFVVFGGMYWASQNQPPKPTSPTEGVAYGPLIVIDWDGIGEWFMLHIQLDGNIETMETRNSGTRLSVPVGSKFAWRVEDENGNFSQWQTVQVKQDPDQQ